MRQEFSTLVRRQALERSGGLCEGVGENVGLPAGERCNAVLARSGRHYDHVWPTSEGGEATLENCAVLCLACHAHKTTKIDAARIAKIRRVRDKHTGARAPSRRSMRHPTLRKKLNGEVVPR